MSGLDRLPKPFGHFIDRDKPLDFQFEGRTYTALEGDSITSALYVNDQKVLSRSFKYHRPRGALTVAGQDGNALVQLPGQPNADGDRELVREGLLVKGQNYFGSLKHDRASLMERFGKFLPAGFYYRTFFRPAGTWNFWEKFIRAFAGLGEIDLNAEHGYYDKKFLFPDVTVVGGGPAGMEAALAAAETGAEVLLIDENQQIGGSLIYSGKHEELDRLRAAVAASENITVMTSAVCTSWFNEHYLSVVQGKRFFKIRTKATVFATGSVEQPIVFRNNDLPGVMMSSGALRLAHYYGVKPGERAVIATVNDHGYDAAFELRKAGVKIAAIVDLREGEGKAAQAARAEGIEVITGHTPWEAIPGAGNRSITGVKVAGISGKGTVSGGTRTIDCDLLCMSGGYFPAAHLICHHGLRLSFDQDLSMFRIGSMPAGMFAAGSVHNTFADEAVLTEGRWSGAAAAAHAGFGAASEKPALDKGAEGINHPFPIFKHPKGKDFVDFDEDQQIKDIRIAVADGYDHVELMKRYTTTGMGPSQGRTSQTAAMHIVADATDQQPGDIGVTTARPPYIPEPTGVLGGRCFEPERLTAMHHRHLEAGAQMMPAGVWWRPAYYGPAAERQRWINEEVDAIRNNVGVIDVSTLGGLEVRGPDAAEFLNRLYTMRYDTVAVGKSRYLLMCDETGVVIDDGVACRFAPNHFYVTATTSGVDNVYRKMLWWNAQWRLDVDVTNVTAAYCGVSLAGPKSRKVLEKLTDAPLGNDDFPFLGVREMTVAGIPCRLLRVGFVGELGYELHAPSSMGEALWDALLEAGREAGIRPVGVEAQRVLRMEKGHVIVSQDTDGLTTPAELDMFWALAKKKPFFVGKRALETRHALPQKRKLVGYQLPESETEVPEESHLTFRNGQIIGRVTSTAYSPTLGRAIGLAYVTPEEAEPGSTFQIKLGSGRRVDAEVVKLPFYDPDNSRQEVQ